MANLYSCPMCEAQVIAENLAGFRCPKCGFSGGNQLSLFIVGEENDGSIRYIGPFDPVKNAQQANLYHLNNEQKHSRQGRCSLTSETALSLASHELFRKIHPEKQRLDSIILHMV